MTQEMVKISDARVSTDNNVQKLQITDYKQPEKQICDLDLVENAVHRIAKLKGKNIDNIIEIGKILHDFCQENNAKSTYNALLKHKDVNLKRTQADKYVAVYDFCINKMKDCQSTDNYKNLGVEKIALLNQINDSRNIEEISQFVTEKEITVKPLKTMIEFLNQDEMLTVESSYRKTLQQIKEVKQLKKEQTKNQESATSEYVKQLEEKNKQLEKEIMELKTKLGLQTKEEKSKNIEAIEQSVNNYADNSDTVQESKNITFNSNDTNNEIKQFSELAIKKDSNKWEYAS